MNQKMTKPELLSPAGSLESFFAAMESGADAVYTGLREFSARAKAKNFSLQEMEKITAYAHNLGRKVYVTLNTLVKERELAQLAETLAALEAMEIDAVILQDLAVWRLAREHFPGIELHASTQMTVHNAAGARMLERMGFTRAVLARELSLAEIADIRRQCTIELEHFIHGALCFSFSGQCYFSSFLGGKSGNRGRCAQPCRRRYKHRNQEGYYFSTNDLSAIDLLPELNQAGVISLKIEGRMKSAEYVANVVSAYRKALDAPEQRRAQAVKEAKELLKSSFGRLPTKGFLPGGIPSDIAIPSLKGSTGRFLGEIVSVRGSEIGFTTKDRLHVGDRLRIQPKTDHAGTAFTVKELSVNRRTAMVAQAGAAVCVPSPFDNLFKVGDAVFKVSSEQAFTLSEPAARRKLDNVQSTRRPVSLHISMPDEHNLVIRGESEGLEVEQSFEVESFVAQERPLDAVILEQVFAKTGEEPFELTSLTAGNLASVVIPPRRMKEVRREFYRGLGRKLEEQRGARRKAHLQQALAALLPETSPRPAQAQVNITLGSLRDAHLLSDPDVDSVCIPLTSGNYQGLERSARAVWNNQDRVIWDIPFILIGEQWNATRTAVRSLAERGFTRFRLNNLGHFPLFDGLEGLSLIAGYRLFSLNSQALLGWKELGASEATLYIEDEKQNLRDLLHRDAGVNTSMLVYGSVPLITSRIPIKAVRPEQPVLSDRGDAYRVDHRSGLSVLSSETDYSLLGRLGELQDLGCRRFSLDLSHLGPFSAKGKQVMEALKRGSAVPETSAFNFDMGLE